LGIEAGSMLVWFDTTPRGGGVPSGVDQLRALGEPVGVGAGFDDGAAVGESVDDGGASLGSVKVLVQPEKDSLHAIATELSPRARQDLKEQLGAAAVQLHVPEFVDAQQNDPSVARDGLRQRFLVGGLDQFVGRAWWPACT
jgi:hypothetical protein